MSGLPALLAQGRVVTVCCGDHRPSGCCDEDCTPCCPECVTCPEVHQHSPDQRAANAFEHRVQRLMTLALADRARQIPALAGVEQDLEGFESFARAAISALGYTELLTWYAVQFACGAEGSSAAELDIPHLEGSLT